MPATLYLLARRRAHWSAALNRAAAALKQFAPYAAMELILPGGSLMALALWLYRRRRGLKQCV